LRVILEAFVDALAALASARTSRHAVPASRGPGWHGRFVDALAALASARTSRHPVPASRGAGWHGRFVEGIFSEDGAGFAALDEPGWRAIHEVAVALDAEALLWSRLKAWRIGDRAPEDMQRALDRAYKNNVVHALAVEREVEEISATFASRGVTFSRLKGAELMRLGVHRDLGARYMHDIDILVGDDQLELARAALAARGYDEAREGESPKHAQPLVRGRVYVEVHTFAYWEADGARVDLARLRGDGTPLARAAVHLLHHLFRSSVNEPVLALKTFWDLREIDRASVDVADLEQLAARAGLSGELGLVRSLWRRGASSRDQAAAMELCRPVDTAELARRTAAFHAGVLLRAPLWYRRLHARSIFAPSRVAMAKIHGRELQGKELAMAYVSRPVRLMARGVRAVAGALKARLRR
jgi:hypothetical protein